MEIEEKGKSTQTAAKKNKKKKKKKNPEVKPEESKVDDVIEQDVKDIVRGFEERTGLLSG